MLIYRHHSLKKLNSFGIECKAAYFSKIINPCELTPIIQHQDYSVHTKLVLGGGSNLLFTSDYRGWVLHNLVKGIEVIGEDENQVWIKIGAGEVWDEVVQYAVDRGYGGIENLSAIPGSAGAAPVQNIGAYGIELKDVFESLHAVNLINGKDESFTHDQCCFGYRDSIFKNKFKGHYFIAYITLRLQKNPEYCLDYPDVEKFIATEYFGEKNLHNIRAAITKIRWNKLPDPAFLGNGGSFFKNPLVCKEKAASLRSLFPSMPVYDMAGGVKIPAAWLIEQAGWKGKISGHTGTYEHHALVIVNHGGATGSEIKAFSEAIKDDVQTRFGILLEPEVNVI